MSCIEKGTGANNRKIHPDFFSEQQYERIKNALGDNVSCKVPGCYNNYAETRNYDEDDETRVINGRCGYHQRIENGELEPNTPPLENEREQIIRNALNTNDELRKLVEANAANVSREFLIEISLNK
jgi:hypothetical protein